MIKASAKNSDEIISAEDSIVIIDTHIRLSSIYHIYFTLITLILHQARYDALFMPK